ncbi:MAG: S4 domain-containing protein [Candidatus Caldarchaeum sp.]
MTHLKSLAAPRHYPKKPTVFTASPRPGGHPRQNSIPLIVVVRDILGYAEDGRTARKLINQGKFQVDGRVVRDPRFPLGLMDLLQVAELAENYRVLVRPRKGLGVFKVGGDEAGIKVCQVVRKNHVRGGGLSIGLHDGRTILFKGEEVERGRSFMALDGLKISVPSQDILDRASLEPGVYGFIVRGSRAGLHGVVSKVRKDVVYPDKPTATVETSQGPVTTLLKNIMPVGVEKPWIMLP